VDHGALTSDGCWVIGLSSSYNTIGSFAQALRLGTASDFHRTPAVGASGEMAAREATIGTAAAWRGRETIVRAKSERGSARAMSGRRAERATDMVMSKCTGHWCTVTEVEQDRTDGSATDVW
jgi:hypothetical protein